MILLTLLIFLSSIVDNHAQPATCIDDIHCSVGFFCHTMTRLCHECLSCELLKRHPGPNESDCIKSDKQCGPCYQGLINDEDHWGAMCLSREIKNMKPLTYIYILVSCVATGVLLSLFIIHGIWNTRIIKINIAIPSCTKVSSQLDPDVLLIKKSPIDFTA